MSLSIGITGLSQSGKSTLFQSLTYMSKSDVTGKKQPLARVSVPDDRLWKLSEIFKPKKTTPATVDFLDMPGGSGGGLGSQAVAEIRTSTVLVEVVRCFAHPYLEGINPSADMDS
ncbi:MAG: 50S ribosome-binding GTPase, partial [bacterium]|nr:50S ribosome-binding GTPase [bacterium]